MAYTRKVNDVVKVGDELLYGDVFDGNGKVKEDVIPELPYIEKYSVLPEASVSNLGKIVQYVGITTESNINGYFYQVQQSGENYVWAAKEVGAGGGSQVQSDWEQSDDTAVDYIKNKPTIPSLTPYRTAAEQDVVDAGLRADIDAIDVDNIGDAHAKSIDLDNLPKICGYPSVIFGTSAPSVTPDYASQMYIDTVNHKIYIADGVANASSFRPLN